MRRISHVIGFDDAPFDRDYRGDVLIVGTVFSGPRLEGVLSGKVRRDGADATRVITRLVSGSRFAEQTRAVMLQGIALAGFNVVDLHGLHQALGIPVLAIARHAPDYEAIRQALLQRVRGGARKWKLIQRASLMEPVAGLFVQLAGISPEGAEDLIKRFAVNGNIPEPLRTAHLIAGGIVRGESRGRT